MSKLHNSKTILFIFFVIFGILTASAFYTYGQFAKTKEIIATSQLQSNVEYIDNIASNLIQMILQASKNAPLTQALKNKNLRKNLENNLRLFKTKRYRYIYVVFKEKKQFKFLLDASKKDKAGFLEVFQPLNVQEWEKVYKTKKANYFINKEVKSLWLTYLKPVIQKGQVTAIVVIDFSLKEQQQLHRILENLAISVKHFTILAILIFTTVVLFLYYLWRQLTMLERRTKEVEALNETLQQKIDEEVAKNREKDKQMLEQARLAQLGEMLGMIAHQWRQPLSAISSANIALNMKAQLQQLDPQSIIELTNKIEELTQHLSTTIDDFRNFFKSDKEKKHTTYTEIVEKSLQIVKSSLKNKNIELLVDLKSDVGFETYPSEIEQVVLNLIKNAEDALIENGIQNPCIKISSHKNILQIRDNAGGIPQEIMDKIFDPYFSTKNLNGTGLGLYMSKIIVEEHCKGKLSVSNDKEGAVFTIELGY